MEDEEFEKSMDEMNMSALEDTDDDTNTDPAAGNVAAYVMSLFNKSSTARETEETRWLRAYRNYRGIYGPDVQFTDTEKSKIFVKVTKTKVNAAYDQITDVLLGSSRFPLSINPTTLPDGVVMQVPSGGLRVVPVISKQESLSGLDPIIFFSSCL